MFTSFANRPLGFSRGLISLCSIWLLTPNLFAQKVELPKEVTGEVGDFVRVEALTDCSTLKWMALDPGLSVFPSDLLKDSKTTVVVGKKPGKYRLIVWGAKGDVPSDAAQTTIVIGSVPPGPDPGPGPSPEPTDPLFAQLKSAFSKEQDSQKADQLKRLSAFYRQAAETALNSTDLKTWGQLNDVMRTAAATMVVSGKLPLVQAEINKDLATRLPTDRSRSLSPDDRALAHSSFQRVAALLDQVK